MIGNITATTGGDDNIFYSWGSSADGNTAAIPDADQPSYTPPAVLTETTNYKRFAHDGTCQTTFTVSDGVWTVTVTPSTEGGEVTGEDRYATVLTPPC